VSVAISEGYCRERSARRRDATTPRIVAFRMRSRDDRHRFFDGGQRDAVEVFVEVDLELSSSSALDPTIQRLLRHSSIVRTDRFEDDLEEVFRGSSVLRQPGAAFIAFRFETPAQLGLARELSREGFVAVSHRDMSRRAYGFGELTQESGLFIEYGDPVDWGVQRRERHESPIVHSYGTNLPAERGLAEQGEAPVGSVQPSRGPVET